MGLNIRQMLKEENFQMCWDNVQPCWSVFYCPRQVRVKETIISFLCDLENGIYALPER